MHPLKWLVSSGSMFRVVVLLCVSLSGANLPAQAPAEPVVEIPPLDRTVSPGVSVTFRVEANGYPPLYYRWRRNGFPLNSASNMLERVTLPGTTTNAGLYDVIVSNPFGSVTSSAARLTVPTQAPALNTEPADTVACPGSAASTYATLGGTGPLSYQWRKEGGPLPGQAGVVPSGGYSVVLTLTNIGAADLGHYDLVVSNAFGMITSRQALLTFTPLFTRQPVSTATLSGPTATLISEAAGCPAVGYQWRSNGVNLPGQIYPALTVSPAVPESSAFYDVVVTNTAGTNLSRTVWLIVTNGVPPTLTCQPTNRTVVAGNSTTFRVCATGSGTLSYLWRQNGTALPPSTNGAPNTRVIPYTLPEHAGGYDVIVSNPWGAVTSEVALLTVTTSPPEMTLQPTNTTASYGQTAYLSARAASAPPPFYQWFKDGALLPGKTNSMLILSPVTLADIGNYAAVAANLAGSVTSAVARLTVTVAAPVIESQPYDQTVSLSSPSNVSFFVYASGAPPPDHQWYHNGAALPGATNYYLYLETLSVADAGYYSVVVSNAAGAVTSRLATLTVIVEPTVVSVYPPSQEVDMGSPPGAYFQASVYGANPLAFQWLHNDQPIPGATDLYLTLGPITPADAGGYRIVASNFVGVVTSAVATLTVRTSPPVFVQQPYGQTVPYGWPSNVFMSAWASGAPAPAYQWFHDGQPVPGATESMLDFFPITSAQAGDYFVVATNVFGRATSQVARLTVLTEAPAFLVQPASRNVEPGYSYDAALWVSVSGALPISYQWRRGPTPIPGATHSTLGFQPAALSDAGSYSVVVSNFVGMATSEVAVVTVTNTPPVIYSQPASRTVLNGTFVSFITYAQSLTPASYQWQHEGTNVPGWTGYSIGFTARPESAGAYRCIVTNLGGSVTSAVALLTVMPNLPTLATEPLSHAVAEGGMAGLYASSPNGAIRWQFNGQDISNAVGSPLVLGVANTGDTGDYTAIATNLDGAVTSRVARLTVLPQGPLDRWEWRRPVPQGNDLFAVAFGVDRILAVGDLGARAISLDNGGSWQGHTQGRASFRRAAYGNGVFVAVANPMFTGGGYDWRAALQLSTNGLDWALCNAPLTNNAGVGDVAFGNGRFVAAASTGFLVSTNGLDWVAAGYSNSPPFFRIAYGNGVFLALSPYYQTTEIAYGALFATSTDGLTWTEGAIAANCFVQDLCFADGRFVVAGRSARYGTPYARVVTSPDTRAWTVQDPKLDGTTLTGNFTAIAAGNGKMTGLIDTWLGLTTSDGINWQTNGAVPPKDLYGLAFGAGRFFAVGDFGNILASADGMTWEKSSFASGDNLRSLARGQGLLAAVGNDGMAFTSPDGIAWTRRSTPAEGNIRGVTWGGGRFVGVGEYLDTNGHAYTSCDGVTWARHPAPTYSGLYSVAFGNGIYAAVGGSGTILYSRDGTNWLPAATTTSERLNSVTYGNGLFVAVGKSATVAVSSNGMQWTSRSYQGGLSDNARFLQGVAWGNGRFVAAGKGGTVLVSANGNEWAVTNGPFGPPYWEDIEDIQFGAGRFLAVGTDGLVASSVDGVLWTRHLRACITALRAALYVDDHFLAVGNNEHILESGFLGPPQLRLGSLPGPAGFKLTVRAETEGAYQLQSSTDLTSWENVLSFSNCLFSTNMNGPTLPTGDRRFFRVVSQP